MRIGLAGRRPLSLRTRLSVLYGLAVVPVFAATLLLVMPASRSGPHIRIVAAWVLAAGTLAGVGLVTIGLRVMVADPLRRLNASVQQWQPGQPFQVAGHADRAPRELLDLEQSFRHAAAALEQREAELRAAVVRQDLLMQEIHHRVKNNLQIVASLMNLQASRIRQPEARAEFQSARDRIRALATLHRHLYADGDLHTVNMRGFLAELCGQLFQAMGETPNDRIRLEIETAELQMSSDQAVPLSLIVTEAVSNAIKYAFPSGRRGFVTVRLTRIGTDAELCVSDDGIGIPAGRAETEAGPRDGIGITLIRGFARQLGATLTVEEGGGTRYLARFTLERDRFGRAAPPAAA